MRRHSPLALTLLLGACISTPHPVVSACRDDASAGAAMSGGPITIVPSAVPGVEIDSASWGTYASTEDIGARERLVYRARLRAGRRLRPDEVALVFREPGRSTSVDMTMSNYYGGLAEIGRDNAAPMDSGQARMVSRGSTIQFGMRVGSSSALSYCPRTTVQVVPRRDVALYLGAGAIRRADATNATPSAGAPLRVVFDSLIGAGEYSTVLVGAVRNTTDTVLRNMVAGVVVHTVRSVVVGEKISPSDGAIRDTIEHLIDSIPPHGLATFTGGTYEPYTEEVVARVTYPASSVTGRAIAGPHEQYRSNHGRPKWALKRPPGSADPVPGCYALGPMLVKRRLKGSTVDDSLNFPARFRAMPARTDVARGGLVVDVTTGPGDPDKARGSWNWMSEDSVGMTWSGAAGYVRLGVAVEGDTLVGGADWYPRNAQGPSAVMALVRAVRIPCDTTSPAR